VQVTVTSYDPTSKTGTLLWGWNNASFLYRASLVSPTASPQILTLSPAPVDAEHTPQPLQAVEVLRTTAVLGRPGDANYIAAPLGQVITLGSGTIFDPASNQLTLPTGSVLPGPYQTDTNPLFVRLWQAQVPFTSGLVTQLDNVSGLAVKVDINALPPATSPLQAWPFWQFAVRPNTPQQVYPQRYLEDSQPPDGPRQWLTSLAVVEPQTGAPPLIHDCRKHFLPLIDLGPCACCELVLDPSEDWQTKLLDAAGSAAGAISVCFQPGVFKVTTKIVISGTSVKMTGAGSGSVYGAAPGTLITGSGLEAVIEFLDCPSVAISDMSVVAGVAGFPSSTADPLKGLQGAVTLRRCFQVDIERVSLACADGDLRAASCLAVYNNVPAAGTKPQQFNVRVLNSQFKVGHFQVGILMVNADRAQVEGNLIVTPPQSLNLTPAALAKRSAIAQRLRKQLLHSMTLVDTAPPTTRRARARLRKKKKGTAAVVAPPTTTVLATAPPAAQAPATPPNTTPAPVTTPAQAGPATAAATKLSHVNLGDLGRARVHATFGTVKLEFISSDKLGSAWNEALKASGLTATSGVGAVQRTVKNIAAAIVNTPEKVAPAFRNYLAATLPQLFSTSSQGIVIGGDVAHDIRILNNTIDGTAQGIHVGLSDLKVSPRPPHLLAARVQICGNTVNIRLTPEMTGDRHGIFLGCVNSAVVNDNHLQLTRQPNAGQFIDAIKIAGFFGPRLLIERNCMLNFTNGIYAVPDATGVPDGVLWKASDNASSSPNSPNLTTFFRVADNIENAETSSEVD
jgi:hypothetical protein